MSYKINDIVYLNKKAFDLVADKEDVGHKCKIVGVNEKALLYNVFVPYSKNYWVVTEDCIDYL